MLRSEARQTLLIFFPALLSRWIEVLGTATRLSNDLMVGSNGSGGQGESSLNPQMATLQMNSMMTAIS